MLLSFFPFIFIQIKTNHIKFHLYAINIFPPWLKLENFYLDWPNLYDSQNQSDSGWIRFSIW